MILSYTPGTAKCSSPAATKMSPVSVRENEEPTFLPPLPLRRRPASTTRLPQRPRGAPRGPDDPWGGSRTSVNLRYLVVTAFGGSRRGRQTGFADRPVRLARGVGSVAPGAAPPLPRGMAPDRQ